MALAFGWILGRRLLSSVPLIVLVSAMIFVILRMLPADPIAMLLPPNATTADAERLREFYGLDLPIYQQYLRWIAGIFTGNLGESIQLKQQVGPLILKTLPASIELVVMSAIIGIVAGIAGGIGMFELRNRRGEFAGEVASVVLLSIPEFLWAIFLLILFGVTYAILPFIGRLEPGVSVSEVTGFLLIDTLLQGRPDLLLSALQHMILPSLALGLAFAPLIMRVMRSSLLEVDREDYVSMARLRGLSRQRVLLNYALRNAALPTVSLIGVQVAFLFGGTLLIEVIYSYPGMGNLMVEAIRAQDLPLIQGIALTYCVVVLLLNAVVDTSYLLLNPKLRSAAK